MPELPEVETVKNTLKKLILNKKIIDVDIYYNNIISYPVAHEFKEKIVNQTINDIERYGKWLMFKLNDYYLVSHLRMEGKFFIKNKEAEITKHEHVVFKLDNGEELRYQDTRKFGKMYLIPIEEVYNVKPLVELGLEPWDSKLDCQYLLNIYKKKKLPIKTVILDQSIIVGIGNIYADEILFLSQINPFTRASDLSAQDCDRIIDNTRSVLTSAIKKGGTTIRSYESSEGVHGRFQEDLLVHNKEGEICPNCSTTILKTKINGRGTYYCPNCQNTNNNSCIK